MLFYSLTGRDSHISVRVRKSIAEKIKEMATENNLSTSDLIEFLVSTAFEEFKKNKIKNKKR